MKNLRSGSRQSIDTFRLTHTAHVHVRASNAMPTRSYVYSLPVRRRVYGLGSHDGVAGSAVSGRNDQNVENQVDMIRPYDTTPWGKVLWGFL